MVLADMAERAEEISEERADEARKRAEEILKEKDWTRQKWPRPPPLWKIINTIKSGAEANRKTVNYVQTFL